MTDPDRVWTLTIPQPCSWLSANDRSMHWARRSSLTKHWRDAALVWARKEKLPKGLAKVRIDAVVHFTDRRKRDAANFQNTLKAIVDGLCMGPKPPYGYGLIDDDDTAHLVGPFVTIGDPSIGAERFMRVGRVVLTITEVA